MPDYTQLLMAQLDEPEATRVLMEEQRHLERMAFDRYRDRMKNDGVGWPYPDPTETMKECLNEAREIVRLSREDKNED